MRKNVWSWSMLFLIPMSSVFGQEIPERTIHYRPGDWVSYPMMRFVRSVSLGNEYVYFGTTGGIARYDFYQDRWGTPLTVSDGLADGDVRVVAYDSDAGALWCATESGLSYYLSSAMEWRNVSYPSLGIGPVHSIGSGEQFLWVEGTSGLFKSHRFSAIFREATEEEEAADGVRWHGVRAQDGSESLPHFFMEHGYLYSPEGTIQDVNLRQFPLTESFQDAYFNLWVGTWGLGGGVADVETSFLKLLPFGPYGPHVGVMAWDESGMWMGGQSLPGDPGGITWWDMDRDAWVYFEAAFLSGLRSHSVTSIVADTTFVWFGTDEGLARYDKERDAWRTFSTYDNLWNNHVMSVALAAGVLWVGTVYGINRIRLPGMIVERVENERLIHRTVHHLEVDEDGVWAATDRGIFRCAGDKARWEYVPSHPGLLYQEATAISALGDEVWFGTDDGIQVYHKDTDAWEAFSAEHFPTGGTIHTMLADTGAVWVGTEDGLLKYVKREDRWRRFTTRDGLLDDSVRWILLDGDYLWLGTGRGLTRFYWNAPYRVD